MSQDFAKKKKKKPSKTAKGLPAWFWLFTGLVSGLFIAFLFYLSGIKPNISPAINETIKEPTLTRQIKAQAERLREGKEVLKKPKFEFYTRLPALTIAAPKAKPQPQSKRKANKKSFMLQAGSFQNMQDADSLKVKLIMQGLDVKIQSIKDSTGNAWHRVQVGPYSSQNKLNKAQDILANNNIPSMLMEMK